MQNLSTNNSELLFRNKKEDEINVYALINGNFKNVTPENLSDEFQKVLTEYMGAVVIVSKSESNPKLEAELGKYSKWCPSGIQRDLTLLRNKLDGVQYKKKKMNL